MTGTGPGVMASGTASALALLACGALVAGCADSSSTASRNNARGTPSGTNSTGTNPTGQNWADRSGAARAGAGTASNTPTEAPGPDGTSSDLDALLKQLDEQIAAESRTANDPDKSD
jgi:hypothetical protein